MLRQDKQCSRVPATIFSYRTTENDYNGFGKLPTGRCFEANGGCGVGAGCTIVAIRTTSRDLTI